MLGIAEMPPIVDQWRQKLTGMRLAYRESYSSSSGSYGGYATLVGLTFTPEVFACGVDIVGPSSLITLLESIPPYWAPMLDMFTIRKHKGDFTPLRVAIVGDILHSRVARSQILALNTLGTSEVRVIAPRTLLPADARTLGVHVYHDLDLGIRDVDVVIMLRLQKERMQGALLPSEHEYYELFGLTEQKLAHASPDVTVMHPGPINRGVEMDSEVADGPRSVILEQVTHGIAVRMAVMSMAMSRRKDRDE